MTMHYRDTMLHVEILVRHMDLKILATNLVSKTAFFHAQKRRLWIGCVCHYEKSKVFSDQNSNTSKRSNSDGSFNQKHGENLAKK